MEDYDDISNSCLMDINSQVIAALHNIEYDTSKSRNNSRLNPLNSIKPSQEVFIKPADKKRKNVSSDPNASKRFKAIRSPSPPPLPTPSPPQNSSMKTFSQILNEDNSYFWDINSQLIAEANNFEYSRGNLKKSNSTTAHELDLVKTPKATRASPRTRPKTLQRIKSDSGLYQTDEIASPTTLRKSNSDKLSISQILSADNSFLMDINSDEVAVLNNIDVNVTKKWNESEVQKKPSKDDIYNDSFDNDNLINLTQCLAEACEEDQRMMSQVKQCIKRYSDDDDVEIVENHETSAVFVSRKKLPTQVKPSTSKVSQNKDSSLCGLSKHHKKFLLQMKGIKDLYDWQYECLALPTVREKQNLIYALPTSGGKSLVAEVLILRELLVHKKNAILLLPFVSIVQEKINDLVPFAMQYGFLVEEYCAGKGSLPPTKRREKNSLYVATTEKCQILIDSLIESNRVNEIGLVVVDEFHMIGDKQRGHNLELLISKFMFLTATGKASIEIIGMSATIENLHEVAKFINADLYTRDFRPIELKEYIKMGDNLFYIDQKAKSIEETFKLERANVGGDFDSRTRLRDPDHISALVLEIIELKSSCLIFCSSKKSCENVALLLADVLPEEISKRNRQEKKNLIESIKLDSGGKICETLNKTIPLGVSYHHSGLTADERRRVEDAFRSGTINVICCTSTLAAGVNLPAGRVIIRSPYVGRDFMPLSTYKQMIGRAGRAGKSEIGDSILICNKNDHQKVVSLLTSKMDYTISNYITKPHYFRSMILNLLSTKLVKNFYGIGEFMQHTLANVQRDNYDRNVVECIKDSIKSLFCEGAIEHKLKTRGTSSPFLEFIDDDGKEIVIYPDNELVISKMGQAAVVAGKTLEEARDIELDLRKASESLVLTQPLHLLYIVSKDIITSININYRAFSEIFFEMERNDKSIIQTAKVIGISMAQVAKMMTSTIIHTETQQNNIKRFYVAMMLQSLWNGEDVFGVSKRFKVDRGIVSKLMSSASAEAYSIFKFCEVFDEFWVYKEILENFSKRLQHCCSVELLPLMELPGVKIGRAKMLYSAGIKSVMDVAALTPEELTHTIKFINIQQAGKVIRAAKYSLKAEFDDNREKLLIMKDVLNKKS